MKTRIIKHFFEIFNSEPKVFSSPGRINIIGEHTDYNNGFVLPAAIDKAVYVAINERDDSFINIYSTEFLDSYVASLADLKKSDKTWANYVLGVIDQFVKRGFKISGFDMIIDGDVPLGAGLSSSAALECAVAFALNDVFDLKLDNLTLVMLTQKAEHEYAGVMCGIMDMFASIYGREDAAIKLDCESLDYEYIPLQLPDYQLVLFNTNVKHSLASSAYNERRQQCQYGVELISKEHSFVRSLRQADQEMLEKYVRPVDSLVYQRCKYVLDENTRLINACNDLKNGNLVGLGSNMYASHKGLSTEYEVSCFELDCLVELTQNDPSVLGARMMGGGFGGCTLNLIHHAEVERLVNKIGTQYREKTSLDCSYYIVSIGNGSSKIN